MLHRGRVAERGTHDELLARGGRYAARVSRDAARERGGAEGRPAALAPDAA